MRLRPISVLTLAGLLLAGCSTGGGGGGLLGGAALLGGGGSSANGVPSVSSAQASAVLGSDVAAMLSGPDQAYAYQAQIRALQDGIPGTPVGWHNPDSGNYGEVVPGPAYHVNAYDCRDYTQNITIGGVTKSARGTACRQADGSWQLVT
jgi:surface antigen